METFLFFFYQYLLSLAIDSSTASALRIIVCFGVVDSKSKNRKDFVEKFIHFWKPSSDKRYSTKSSRWPDHGISDVPQDCRPLFLMNACCSRE